MEGPAGGGACREVQGNPGDICKGVWRSEGGGLLNIRQVRRSVSSHAHKAAKRRACITESLSFHASSPFQSFILVCYVVAVGLWGGGGGGGGRGGGGGNRMSMPTDNRYAE